MSHFVMRVFDDFQEECNSSMLYDNMNISRLMLHARHVEGEGLRERVVVLRGQDILIVVLQRVGLISKNKTRLKKRFSNSLNLVMIMCLSLVEMQNNTIYGRFEQFEHQQWEK